MKRVTLIVLANLLLLAAALMIGQGCSQDNPTEPAPITAPSLAQDLYFDDFDAPDLDHLWRDNFETYEVGTFPDTWIPDGNCPEGGTIVDDVFFRTAQSFRLYGVISPYGQWAAIAYRPISVSPPFEVRVAIRNGDEELIGPWPARGAVELNVGTSWEDPSVRLVLFTHDNRIIGRSGIELGTYNPLQWYKVKVLYERPDADHVQLTYWIDNAKAGVEILDAATFESELDHLSVVSMQGTAWFDPIMVIARD